MNKYIPIGTKRRSGQKLKAVKFLTLHDTGNPGSTAIQNVSYFIRSANEMSASAHCFIDDKDIIWCIPEDEKAWGVRYNCSQDNLLYGDDANDVSIQFELCYGGRIDNKKAYENLKRVFVVYCHKYNLDPLKKIAGHFELDPGRKTDPFNGLSASGHTFEEFKRDVSNAKRLAIISIIKQKLYDWTNQR